jgi:hypothetical protein
MRGGQARHRTAGRCGCGNLLGRTVGESVLPLNREERTHKCTDSASGDDGGNGASPDIAGNTSTSSKSGKDDSGI